MTTDYQPILSVLTGLDIRDDPSSILPLVAMECSDEITQYEVHCCSDDWGCSYAAPLTPGFVVDDLAVAKPSDRRGAEGTL